MDSSVAEICAEVEGVLVGDGARRITGFAGLETAGPNDLSFARGDEKPQLGEAGRADDSRAALAMTRAGAVVVSRDGDAPTAADGVALIRVDDPEAAFNRLARAHGPRPPEAAAGIHPTAVVAEGAQVDPTAAIGPYVVIEAGARVGARTQIGAHGYVGHDVTIGEDCRFFPSVVVRERSAIGDRVVLEAGAVIGSDGFGWEPGPRGPQRIPQVGRVVIEDDVEVGANATVDRARLDETRVGRGSKLDNMVHLGHNVRLGGYCLFAAQVGAAGTTSFGSGVEVGGQCGFAGHMHVGDGTRIAAQSGLMRDTEPGSAWMGSPAFPLHAEKKAILLVHQLDAMFKRVKKLERALDEAKQ